MALDITLIPRIREALAENNGDTVFHLQTLCELTCTIPELGALFEVRITVYSDGSIHDVVDNLVFEYPDFDAWKADQIG